MKMKTEIIECVDNNNNSSDDEVHGYKGDIDIRQILKGIDLDDYEEAICICDLSDVVNKYYTWKRYMPRVTPFYAVKCNDNLSILRTLAKLGTGFDCASKGEIAKVLSLGVKSNRIIFANPTKPQSHIIYSVAHDVKTYTFDNSFELYKIQKYCPDANLVLRIRFDAVKAQCPLGEKFGCDPKAEARNLITLARDLNLKVVGISFHVGSGCMDFSVYEGAIRASKELFDFAKSLGIRFNLLDIGGGFPGDKNTSIVEVSQIINDALEKYFPDNSVRVIAEPGRFFVSSSCTLICKIHSKKMIIDKEKSDCKVMYYINDGVYGSFNSILYDHQVATPLFIKKCDEDVILLKSSIWGPTCDALDQICETAYLPNLDISDVIVFENMGAYTFPVASEFNGFPLPVLKFYIREADHYLLSMIDAEGEP